MGRFLEFLRRCVDRGLPPRASLVRGLPDDDAVVGNLELQFHHGAEHPQGATVGPVDGVESDDPWMRTLSGRHVCREREIGINQEGNPLPLGQFMGHAVMHSRQYLEQSCLLAYEVGEIAANARPQDFLKRQFRVVRLPWDDCHAARDAGRADGRKEYG